MTAELLGFDLPPRGPVALAASIAAWRRGTPHPLPDQPLSDADWNPFFAVVARNRLTGLLTDAVASGAFPLTSTQRRALTRVHNFMILRVMHLERAALELVAELNELGIEHRLLKGAALARTVHADPDLRPYADVDLLVPSARFDDAIEAFAAGDAKLVHVQPRPGFVGRFGKGVELIRPDGISIDLHRALAPGVWAVLMNPDALFQSKTDVALDGALVHGLGPAERFLHACYHATVGSRALSLMALRDVVETALSSDSSIDQEVLDLAEDWQATSVVAAAVQLAWQVLAPVMTTPMVEFAHAHRPDGRSERRLRLRPTSGDARPPEVMEMVRAIPGMQSRAAYLSALAFPSSDYLAERGQTRANRLMGGLRRLSR